MADIATCPHVLRGERVCLKHVLTGWLAKSCKYIIGRRNRRPRRSTNEKGGRLPDLPSETIFRLDRNYWPEPGP